MPMSVDSKNCAGILDSFRDFAKQALEDNPEKGGNTLARLDGNGGYKVQVATDDKIGKWFRSSANEQDNRDVRKVFLDAIKLRLNASNDEELVRRLGNKADVLKMDDFNSAKGRPLSARRISEILSATDEIVKPIEEKKEIDGKLYMVGFLINAALEGQKYKGYGPDYIAAYRNASNVVLGPQQDNTFDFVEDVIASIEKEKNEAKVSENLAQTMLKLGKMIKVEELEDVRTVSFKARMLMEAVKEIIGKLSHEKTAVNPV